MGVTTADAMMAAASCNVLLDAIDRLETMIKDSSEPTDDRVWQLRIGSMKEWILDARGTVLDIKARL